MDKLLQLFEELKREFPLTGLEKHDITPGDVDNSININIRWKGLWHTFQVQNDRFWEESIQEIVHDFRVQIDRSNAVMDIAKIIYESGVYNIKACTFDELSESEQEHYFNTAQKIMDSVLSHENTLRVVQRAREEANK